MFHFIKESYQKCLQNQIRTNKINIIKSTVLKKKPMGNLYIKAKDDKKTIGLVKLN